MRLFGLFGVGVDKRGVAQKETIGGVLGGGELKYYLHCVEGCWGEAPE